MAEAFLRRALVERFGRQAPTVSSAGTIAVPDGGATSEAITVAAEHGLDISGHAARLLERALLREDADLILGMAADHVERILEVNPDARARTFTLKELVRILEDLPAPAPGTGPSSLVDRVVTADDRRRREPSPHVDERDVVDPIGHPLDTYRAVAWELSALCDRLVYGLFGLQEKEAIGES